MIIIKSGLSIFKKIKKHTKRAVGVCSCIIAAAALCVFAINFHVMSASRPFIITKEQAEDKSFDCILVLGAGIRGNRPTAMLKDRLDTAIALYKSGVSKKLLMSGDHGNDNHNEVGVMKLYAINNGVSPSDVFMDHAGFSTYESLYRAKELFGCKNIVAVTQEYHLYRTVFLGNKIGLEINGVPADKVKYKGAFFRETREILARNKDFAYSLFRPKLQINEESIPIDSDGGLTDDDAFAVLTNTQKEK